MLEADADGQPQEAGMPLFRFADEIEKVDLFIDDYLSVNPRQSAS